MGKNKIHLLKFDGKNNSLYFALGRFNIVGFYGVEAKNGLVIRINFDREFDIFKKHPSIKNKEVIDIDDYVTNLFFNRVNEALKNYIRFNIHDYSFYNKDFIYLNRYDIKSEIKLDNNIYKEEFMYDYSDINNNIVLISYKTIGSKIKLDLNNDKMEFSKNGEKIDILECFLEKEQLNKIIAKEQYKIGIAPKLFYYMANLQVFLQNKEKIKIITKDNKEYSCKRRYYKDLSNIIHMNCIEEDYYIQEEYIEDSNEDISLKDVCYLKNKNEEFYFDNRALSEPIV